MLKNARGDLLIFYKFHVSAFVKVVKRQKQKTYSFSLPSMKVCQRDLIRT